MTAGGPEVLRSIDAIVVGAGLIGCAVAMHLAERGRRVHVLEQAGVACATSGSGMGHVFVVPRPAGLARMTLRSAELWDRFAQDTLAAGEALFWRPTGVHWLAGADADLASLERVARELRQLGEEVRELSPRALVAREPALAGDLAGGVFHPRDAVTYPVHAAAAMLRRARRAGATVSTGIPVERILLEPGQGEDARVVGVRAGGRDLQAPFVVQCTGILAPDLAGASGLSIPPVFPRRGEVAVTAPDVNALDSQVLEVGYLDQAQGDDLPDPEGAADPGSASCYLQPQTGGRCLIGATRRFPAPAEGMDRRVDRALLARSLQRAFRFVPMLRRAPIVRAWTGLRPFTRDRRPMVGPVPGVSGLLLACGHEGLGLTLSQITGSLVAGMVTDTLPRDLAADAADWLPEGRMPRVVPERWATGCEA